MLTFPFTLFSDAGFVNEYSTSFNGVDENVNCSPESTPIVNNISVFAWIKLPNNTSTRTFIANRHTGIAQRAWALSVNSAGNIKLKISSNGTSDTKDLTTTGENVENNGWHLVGFTYSTATQAKIYVDASEATYGGTDGAMTDIHSSTANLYIGALSNGIEDFLGNIDEATIWSGSILTASDITNLYNSGVPVDPETLSTSATLEHYWKMGDGDTTQITDQIGSNNGSFINMDSSNFVTDVPS